MSSNFRSVSSVQDFFSALSIPELSSFAESHPHLQEDVNRHICTSRDSIIIPFCSNVRGFWESLRSGRGVVSGSAALKLILPQWTCGWQIQDLDLYLAHGHETNLIAFLANEGFIVVGIVEDGYGELAGEAIDKVISLRRGEKSIDVIIASSSLSAIAPIFRFHSTPVMNFFNAEVVFSAYPGLTIRYQGLVNYGRITTAGQEEKGHLLRCWQKYENRGYRFKEVSRRTVSDAWSPTVALLKVPYGVPLDENE
ncbi:hypothetical protein BJ138DRAFT_1118279 [Hygrophoropsis aurantiaca]|uniref:Uncharacterized protein n=1 Tax=Hygrophoropsis aurantiaca TaxID=72124 RepID=A0ACB7ZY69_9AGAM|nr:hypothetical protein BJ138DRAFT_1118279 [Hygrophoropsis aurantiaca]